MRNQSKLFLFLLSLMLISSVMAIPEFTNPISSPINNSNYTCGQTYRFNITIADSNGTAQLNLSGVFPSSFPATLYTATNSSSNFTVLINTLEPATYTYNWISTNGTNTNSSIYYFYKLNRGNLVASLTSSAGWNINYLVPTTIGYSGSNCGDGDVAYKIYKDDVYIGTGETGTFNIGSYVYKLNTTAGGGTNYSGSASLNTNTLTIARESGGDTIHGTLVGTGAGLGIFILYLAQALPTLLIVFALIGVVVLIGFVLVKIIIKSFNL